MGAPPVQIAVTRNPVLPRVRAGNSEAIVRHAHRNPSDNLVVPPLSATWLTHPRRAPAVKPATKRRWITAYRMIIGIMATIREAHNKGQLVEYCPTMK